MWEAEIYRIAQENAVKNNSTPALQTEEQSNEAEDFFLQHLDDNTEIEYDALPVHVTELPFAAHDTGSFDSITDYIHPFLSTYVPPIGASDILRGRESHKAIPRTPRSHSRTSSKLSARSQVIA